MLKIKDDIDLSILEKYGDDEDKFHDNGYGFYESEKCLYEYDGCYERFSIISISKKTRRIEVDVATEFGTDVLYDLIKDGLVEKE